MHTDIYYIGFKTTIEPVEQKVNKTTCEMDKKGHQLKKTRWKTLSFLISQHAFFAFFGEFKQGTSFAHRPHSINATDFGSEPYLSATPTDGSAHFLDHNHEGGEHQPRTKPKLNSLYL